MLSFLNKYDQPPEPTVAVEAEEPELEPDAEENIEMQDSALFDVVINYHDGRRIRIPQQSTPADWVSPF